MMAHMLKILPALLIVSTILSAKILSVDSLYSKLHASRHDSQRVLLMNEIGYQLGETYLDSALEILHAAGNLSNKIGFEFGAAMTAYHKSSIYSYTGKLDSASIMALRSLQFFERINDTSRVYGQTRIIAKIYQLLNQMEQAWVYYQRAYKLAQIINEPKELGTSLNDLGSYYINKGWYITDSIDHFFTKAQPYFYKAIEQYNRAEYDRGVAMCYGNLAFISEQTGNFEEAIGNSLHALKYFEKLNNKKGPKWNIDFWVVLA